MLDVERLKADLNQKLENWNERSSFTVAGVKNLSRADIDTLLVLCEEYDYRNSLKEFIFSIEIECVLRKYGWDGE